MYPPRTNPPQITPWRPPPEPHQPDSKPMQPRTFKLPQLPQLGSPSSSAPPPLMQVRNNQPTFAQIVQQAQQQPPPPPPPQVPTHSYPPGTLPPNLQFPPTTTNPHNSQPQPKTINIEALPQLSSPSQPSETANIIGSVNAQMMPKLNSSSGMSGLNSVLPGMGDHPQLKQPPPPPLNNLSISGREPSHLGHSDQSGLKPLIGVIESKDKERQSVILGTDLGLCGLDISNNDLKLAKKLGSPWQELDMQPVIPDFTLPNCYKIDTVVPQQRKLQNFDEGALFYIFYTMPRDAMQEAAAVELTNRSWRYHKELQMWLTKDPLTEPVQTSLQEETGVYIFFDPLVWRKIKREYVLFYPDIAEFVSWKPLVRESP